MYAVTSFEHWNSWIIFYSQSYVPIVPPQSFGIFYWWYNIKAIKILIKTLDYFTQCMA